MSQEVSKQQEALEEMKKQFEIASTELASPDMHYLTL